jgi:outer membrane immunogenic protein
MRFILFAALALGAASAAMAQEEMYRGDAGVTYQWVHTNAGPGECGCFGLNGAEISGSWDVRGPWAIVTDFSSDFRGANFTASQSSLTVTSFLAGARYRLPQPWIKGAHRPLPFAQVLIGPAHAGGGEAGVGDGSYAFAARIGGGIDIPLKFHFEVRAVQADWFRSQFANAKNDHQNNLMISTGIIFRWSHSK